jgi:hypothetical protein
MTTNRDLFAKHVALGAFIETGTCHGRSVGIALELGFTRIYSVEADKERYEHCRTRFAGNPAVVLWCAESVAALPEMISGDSAPVLFWLDAHPSGDGSFGQDYLTNPAHAQTSVLARELQIIKDRNVKGDVILIDDLDPETEAFATKLFPEARISFHDTEGRARKVMEIET